MKEGSTRHNLAPLPVDETLVSQRNASFPSHLINKYTTLATGKEQNQILNFLCRIKILPLRMSKRKQNELLMRFQWNQVPYLHSVLLSSKIRLHSQIDLRFISFVSNAVALYVNKHLNICADEQPNHDERSIDTVRSSPPSQKKTTLTSPLRKVLSPINTNMNTTKPADEFSFTEQPRSILLEPKTPKTPSIFACADSRLQNIGTPLDKFNSRSFNLKVDS